MFSGENEASWATLGWIRRSLTPGSVALAGAASLNAPNAAMSASASAASPAGASLSRLSPTRHSVAGAANMAMVRNVSPCRPTSEAI